MRKRLQQIARPLRPNQAFTLMEILAAILIFAFLTFGISSTMRQITRITKKVQLRAASIASAEVGMDRLQRDLQMAFNERLQGSPSFFKAEEASTGPDISFTYFDSEIKTLFVQRTPGVMAARYTVEKDEDGTMRLVRTQVSSLAIDKLKDATKQVVAGGVLAFSAEFYDARNDRWLKAWDTAGQTTHGYFPKAVKISIETTNPDLPKEEWKNKSLKLETSFLLLNELEDR